MELARKIESARHSVTEIEQKHTLLRGFTREFDVTAEIIMDGIHGY